MNKKMPLLGARVSVLCPGSWSGLGEFDGGVGAQIPGKKRGSRDEYALRYPLNLAQGPLPWADVAEGRVVQPGTLERNGLFLCSPFMEPLLGVGEVGTGAIVISTLWPGLTQVLGRLMGAVHIVMSEVILGPRLCWSPGLELPAFWGLHGQ